MKNSETKTKENMYVDNYITGFCKSALEALQKQDVKIAENLQQSRYNEFYRDDYKGLGLFGTCERDLQYIIFSELCRNYKIYPEYTGGYKNRQRVDIALWPDDSAAYEDDLPGIAIEMKWAVFTRSGALSEPSQQKLVDDVLKMKRGCVIPHKYFMQFAITKTKLNLESDSEKSKIEDDVNQVFYKNQFRRRRLALTYFGSFETLGADMGKEHFNMLLWKICETL